MSSDRELLEKAAKAAGIPAYWSVDGTVQNRPIFVVEAGGKMGTMPYECEWNPLKNDADALRLAVKLGLHICHMPALSSVVCETDSFAREQHYWDDPYAATRRAIVKAAATIYERAAAAMADAREEG